MKSENNYGMKITKLFWECFPVVYDYAMMNSTGKGQPTYCQNDLEVLVRGNNHFMYTINMINVCPDMMC